MSLNWNRALAMGSLPLIVLTFISACNNKTLSGFSGNKKDDTHTQIAPPPPSATSEKPAGVVVSDDEDDLLFAKEPERDELMLSGYNGSASYTFTSERHRCQPPSQAEVEKRAREMCAEKIGTTPDKIEIVPATTTSLNIAGKPADAGFLVLVAGHGGARQLTLLGAGATPTKGVCAIILGDGNKVELSFNGLVAETFFFKAHGNRNADATVVETDTKVLRNIVKLRGRENTVKISGVSASSVISCENSLFKLKESDSNSVTCGTATVTGHGILTSSVTNGAVSVKTEGRLTVTTPDSPFSAP